MKKEQVGSLIFWVSVVLAFILHTTGYFDDLSGYWLIPVVLLLLVWRFVFFERDKRIM